MTCYILWHEPNGSLKLVGCCRHVRQMKRRQPKEQMWDSETRVEAQRLSEHRNRFAVAMVAIERDALVCTEFPAGRQQMYRGRIFFCRGGTILVCLGLLRGFDVLFSGCTVALRR